MICHHLLEVPTDTTILNESVTHTYSKGNGLHLFVETSWNKIEQRV